MGESQKRLSHGNRELSGPLDRPSLHVFALVENELVPQILVGIHIRRNHNMESLHQRPDPANPAFRSLPKRPLGTLAQDPIRRHGDVENPEVLDGIFTRRPHEHGTRAKGPARRQEDPGTDLVVAAAELAQAERVGEAQEDVVEDRGAVGGVDGWAHLAGAVAEHFARCGWARGCGVWRTVGGVSALGWTRTLCARR